MSLARLVLNKSILAGLRVLFRDEPTNTCVEGIIQEYDEEHDCFQVLNEPTSRQYALQFHQFTVEEEQQQLVLKVSHCIHVVLPDPTAAVADAWDNDGEISNQPLENDMQAAGDRLLELDAACRQVSGQLSVELSQQLSGLVGQSFSHTEHGFETVVSPNAAALVMQSSAPALATQGAEGDQEEDDHEHLYWGSPVKHDTVMAAAAAAAADAMDAAVSEVFDNVALTHATSGPDGPGASVAADTAQLPGEDVAATEAALATKTALETILAAKELLHNTEDEGQLAATADAARRVDGISAEVAGPTPAASTGAELQPAAADTVDSVCSTKRTCRLSSCSSVSQQAAEVGVQQLPRSAAVPVPAPRNCAADASFTSFKEISRMISMSDEQGAGQSTPGRHNKSTGHGLAARLLDASTWGSPRESEWGTPREHAEEQQQHTVPGNVAGIPGQKTARLAQGTCNNSVDSCAGLPFQSFLSEAEQQPIQQQPESSDDMSDAAVTLGVVVPNSSAAMAADAAASSPEAATNAACNGLSTSSEMDFTIAAAVDMHPVPATRSSRRTSRELYRIPSSDATDAGMMVDIPQPLTTRRSSRMSIRSVYMPSDPGVAYGSSGSGTAPNTVELRRMTSVGISSRRVSRNTSSRLNADQDWGITGPDEQVLPQLMGSNNGASLQMPGPVSRRASRTLSGRLPPDQDAAVPVVHLAQLSEADPDVLVRPVTAATMALDTIFSRRDSGNGRPGTPDSDGFGYSEFEGVEPLVPPELAQQDAIVEEAVILAAAEGQAATGVTSRHQRRSARSIPAIVAAPVTSSRLSLRLSNQDEPVIASRTGPGITGCSCGSQGRVQSGQTLANEPGSGADSSSGSVFAQQEASPAVSLLQAVSGCVNWSNNRNTTSLNATPENMPPTGGESSQRSAAGSAQSSRRISRSMSGVAAAIAAAAEAAATAVGYALGGKGVSEEQQGSLKATTQSDQESTVSNASICVRPAEDGTVAAGAAVLKSKTCPDPHALQPAESFTCPEFIPALGSSSSGKSSLNPFVHADINYQTCHTNQLEGGSCSNIAAFQIGTAVAPDSGDVMQQHFHESPPCGLLRKQLLPPAASVEGSEWGSGTFLSTHINSGVDSPIGSAVFKMNPFDAGELSAALEEVSTSAHNSKPGVGASRMGREAAALAVAAAAAAANSLPFGGWGATGAGNSASIHEITPADSDSDSEKYVSGRGGENGTTHHSRLALASSDADMPQTSSEQQQLEQQQEQHDELGFQKQQSGFGQQQVGFQEQQHSSNINRVATHHSAGFAAAYVQAAAVAAADSISNGSERSSDSSEAGNSTCLLPPTYSESVAGADADDEGSIGTPDRFSARRVWPAEHAHRTAVQASTSQLSDAASAATVRHEADLAVGASGRVSYTDDTTTALLNAGSTGLVRRSRPVSRAPSQQLPAGVGATPSSFQIDGMTALPTASYNYEDDDSQPLVQQQKNMVMCAVEEARAQIGHVVLHSFLAVSAQWFDLIALVVLGSQLTAAMMSPQLTQYQQLGRLFGIFAAGHVLWLVGAFVWPWMTAHVGRKTVLAWTAGLSAFCTALLGCMPAYSEGANAGIIVVVILRCVAGLAVSNDAPAAIAYLTEHAPQMPCLHASLVPCAMAAGAFCASAVGLFFAWVLSTASLGVFGWRLALVSSLLANGVSGALRGYAVSDPEQHMHVAELADRRNGHVWRALRYHPGQVLETVALQAFAVCGLYLMAAWLPVHFVQLTGLKASLGITIHTINMAVLTATVPLGGFLADTYGSTYMLLTTCASAAMFAYPAWLLFSLSVAGVSWFAQFVLVGIVGLHWGALAGVLPGHFPKGVRSSAVTLSYVLTMVLLGCSSPLIGLGFITQTHSLASPAIVMILSAIVTGGTVLATTQLSSSN